MSQIHKFSVGDINCIALAEGSGSIDSDAISQRYPNATEDEIQAALDALGNPEQITGYLNILLVEADGKKILFDAGMGLNPNNPNIGQLIASLDEAGISPEEIDIVFITHFHGDHYLGLMTDGTPTFPNASYLTRDEEWNFWLENEDDSLAQRTEGIKAIVDPMRDKFSTIKAGENIVEGVSVMAIPGHTMGQSAIKVKSGDDLFIHLVDLLHHTSQLTYPHWHIAFDTDGDLAVQSRQAQLSNAATRDYLVMFYHLPFPGLGYVERADGAFAWKPIESE